MKKNRPDRNLSKLKEGKTKAAPAWQVRARARGEGLAKAAGKGKAHTIGPPPGITMRAGETELTPLLTPLGFSAMRRFLRKLPENPEERRKKLEQVYRDIIGGVHTVAWFMKARGAAATGIDMKGRKITVQHSIFSDAALEDLDLLHRYSNLARLVARAVRKEAGKSSGKCQECGGVLPVGRRVYCSPTCSNRARQRRFRRTQGATPRVV